MIGTIEKCEYREINQCVHFWRWKMLCTEIECSECMHWKRGCEQM